MTADQSDKALSSAFYPQQVPIDAYGNGGFRFADMSHQGSLLCLPSGIYAWNVAPRDGVTPAHLAQVLREGVQMSGAFLLLGTGSSLNQPSEQLRDAVSSAGLGLEVMDTGAAARTLNVLLAEKRAVIAALIAVA